MRNFYITPGAIRFHRITFFGSQINEVIIEKNAYASKEKTGLTVSIVFN